MRNHYPPGVRFALGLKDIGDLSAGFDSKQRVFIAMAGISF